MSWDSGTKAPVVPRSLGVAGGGGGVRETFGKGGDGFAVSFEGFAFVVGEVELFEHFVDAVLDGYELAAA
ncbi:hypothetical protein ACFXMT_49620 [Streptomyces mirabilis]|uniref:hypothetical protein n=2 Tax=Streptomyces mirabilis TaxID=68239 RepID=UPI00369C0616